MQSDIETLGLVILYLVTHQILLISNLLFIPVLQGCVRGWYKVCAASPGGASWPAHSCCPGPVQWLSVHCTSSSAATASGQRLPCVLSLCPNPQLWASCNILFQHQLWIFIQPNPRIQPSKPANWLLSNSYRLLT